jgi:hypothetical protein
MLWRIKDKSPCLKPFMIIKVVSELDFLRDFLERYGNLSYTGLVPDR